MYAGFFEKWLEIIKLMLYFSDYLPFSCPGAWLA